MKVRTQRLPADHCNETRRPAGVFSFAVGGLKSGTNVFVEYFKSYWTTIISIDTLVKYLHWTRAM